MDYCYRHKTTALENGVCPECGAQPVTTGSLPHAIVTADSVVTMTEGKNSTTTEWVETKPKVTFKKTEPKKKGKK